VATPQTRSTRPAPAGSSKQKKSAGAEAWEWVKSLGVALVLFLVLRTFLVQAFSIPSRSMERTLLVGDYLMANNALFGPHLPFSDARLPGFREPRHGDIVVFRPTYNQPVIDVVKRVIGEPGDTLQSVDGVIVRNGKRLAEPYKVPPATPEQPIAYTGTGGGAFLPPEIDPAKYGYHNHVPALLPAGVLEPDHQVIEVRPQVQGNLDEIFVTYDGQAGYPLQEGDVVRVRRSERTLRLIKAPTRSYFELLREKLKWGERGGRE